MLDRKKIGEILVDLGLLTPAEVERVLQAMKRRPRVKFGQVARDMGLIREEHVLAALAVQMQLFPGIQDLGLKRLLGRLLETANPSSQPTWSRQRRQTSRPGK